MICTRVVAVAAVVLATAAAPIRGHAQSASPVPILDVPYLPQSEALCGGAAAAMVMRFWGVAGVYAESFSSLVDASAEGIRGEDLVRAFEARGWQAVSLRGDRAVVQTLVAKRQPAIALIEDRPGRLHYVVIVSWPDGKVIYHDPARAPFRVADEADFERRWQAARFWTLVALPPAGAPGVRPDSDPGLTPVGAGADPGLTPGGACGAMVWEAVRLAGAAQAEDARRLLEAATASCPDDPGPWRELAGLHALKEDWRSASADARRALTRDPRDAHAARILATASFVEGDELAALDAWNLVAEPLIDLIDVRGLDRLRYEVAARALGLKTGTILDRAALARARKRLDAVPGVLGARVTYRPADDGRATVAGTVIERSAVPSGAVQIGAIGIRAAVSREILVDVANLSGSGEVWSVSWRWWERRPRAGLAFASPSPFGGTWGIDVFDERQTYGDDGAEIEERRRSASFAIADWITASIRMDVRAGFDRIAGANSLRLGAGLRHAAAGERLATDARAAVWRGDLSTWAAALSAEWRSRAAHQGTIWVVHGGADVAAGDAPFAIWQGASTGEGRSVLLRAHPLLDDGIIRGGVFGPRLAYVGAEWRRWSAPKVKVVRLAPAIFVDVAHAWRAPGFADARAHADVGAGVRVALPAVGVFRVDLAKGLRDGATAISLGLTR